MQAPEVFCKKKVFLKISRNSPVPEFSFLIKLQAWGAQTKPKLKLKLIQENVCHLL